MTLTDWLMKIEWGSWEAIIAVATGGMALAATFWRHIKKPFKFVWNKIHNALIESVVREALADINLEAAISKAFDTQLSPPKNGKKNLYSHLQTINEKVDANNEFTRTVSSLNRMAFFEMDMDGGCTYVSPEACAITDRDSKEFIGQNWVALVHEMDRDAVIEEWERVLKSRSTFHKAFRMIKRDGKTIIWICAMAQPIKTGYLGKVTLLEAGKPNDCGIQVAA